MSPRTIFCLLLIATNAPAAEPPEKGMAIATVEELWAGFDPRALPLDIEVVKA